MEFWLLFQVNIGRRISLNKATVQRKNNKKYNQVMLLVLQRDYDTKEGDTYLIQVILLDWKGKI